MSTRATYQFRNRSNQFEPATTIYIHYDGYPTGAAVYLWNLLHVENKRGCLATQFIRANDLAELTKSHETHSDTEYRYTFVTYQKQTHLKAEKLNDSGSWTVFFEGEWIDFINKYGSLEYIENFEPIKECQIQYGKQYLTKSQLKAETERAERELQAYQEKFPTFIGNIDGMARGVANLQESLSNF